MFVVELEDGVWLAPWTGDPGRTLDQYSARKFVTIRWALSALKIARKFRAFPNAKIYEGIVGGGARACIP